MKRRPLFAAIAVVLGVVGATAAPAVAGQWTEPGTWGSGTTIGMSNTNQGNVVGLWQLMLSTRYRSGSGTGFTPPITGVFGSATDSYTRVWQAEHAAAGLSADGVVGPATWSAARFFHVPANPYQSGSWRYFQDFDANGYPGQVSMPYAVPFTTWFFRGCPSATSASGTEVVGWTTIDLPGTC